MPLNLRGESISSLYLILFVFSLGMAAFFCSAETAFVGMQKLRLQHLLQTGNARAKLVARIMEHPEKFLATVLLGTNFFETAVATLGTLMAISLWGEQTGAAVATILVTLITLVFAEFMPKSLAARYGERMALSYARPIAFISILFYPFVYVLNHVGIRFGRLWGEVEATPTISEEEFHTMITVGHREGTMEDETAEMLHNVFDFANRPVREVMIPRTEVIFIEKGMKIADFMAIYAEHPLSRFPVYEVNRDNVVGILSIKDVFIALSKGTINQEGMIDGLIRSAYFAPETKPISELFAEMRDKNYRLAVVVDEFGGTAGIVDLVLLLEEIVGPMGDELIKAEKDYEVINEHTFQIDGGMRVEDANEEMGLELPAGDYETVAGFILHLLGRIPQQGEQLKYKGLKLVITRMRGVKIEEVLVTREKIVKGAEGEIAAPAG